MFLQTPHTISPLHGGKIKLSAAFNIRADAGLGRHLTSINSSAGMGDLGAYPDLMATRFHCTRLVSRVLCNEAVEAELRALRSEMGDSA